MYTPALLTRVSMRPNRPSAASMIRSAVAGSVMSPATASTSGSSEGAMVRALATTAQPRARYPATRPAPMPCEPPVMMATLPAVSAVLIAGPPRSRRGDQLLAPLGVVGPAGPGGVCHDVHGEG